MPTEREEQERQARAEAKSFRSFLVPPPLSEGAMEALAALEAYATTSLADLSEWHKEMFREYEDELAGYFRRYSRPGRSLDPDKTPDDVWAVEAVQGQVLGDLATSFAELSEALYVEDVEAMEEWLDDAMVEGHQRELWLLAMGGIDIDPYVESLSDDEEERTLLLLALGVAGLSWATRLGQWRDRVTLDAVQWMHASIVGGQSLDDTLTGLNRITDSFTGRVQGLAENEMVRAFDTGGNIALEAVEGDHAVTEVWVTRNDRLVCGICGPRHMKVTALQPIRDSHPGCRCRKVPVPEDYTHTDVDYDDLFASALEGDEGDEP
jgi:hypothetical protein